MPGGRAVFFFANPDQVGSLEDNPDAPILFLLRVEAAFIGAETVESPEDLLTEALDMDRDQVKPFSLEAFPAARVVISETESESGGVVYALRLDEDNWLIVGLVAPRDQNVLLLDETIILPVLHSIEVTGDMSPVPAEPVYEPTEIIVITATPETIQSDTEPGVTPTSTPDS